MGKYILKRVLLMIPVLLGVMFIVFAINHFMPGDPVISLLGNNYTQEQYDALQREIQEMEQQPECRCIHSRLYGQR